MKTEQSLRSSAEACLNQAKKQIQAIDSDLAKLATGDPIQKVMPRLRLQILELEKNVHEYNAYSNALNTK